MRPRNTLAEFSSIFLDKKQKKQVTIWQDNGVRGGWVVYRGYWGLGVGIEAYGTNARLQICFHDGFSNPSTWRYGAVARGMRHSGSGALGY